MKTKICIKTYFKELITFLKTFLLMLLAVLPISVATRIQYIVYFPIVFLTLWFYFIYRANRFDDYFNINEYTFKAAMISKIKTLEHLCSILAFVTFMLPFRIIGLIGLPVTWFIFYLVYDMIMITIAYELALLIIWSLSYMLKKLKSRKEKYGE